MTYGQYAAIRESNNKDFEVKVNIPKSTEEWLGKQGDDLVAEINRLVERLHEEARRQVELDD